MAQGQDTQPQTADLVILGAGSGGYACALRAAELGLSVVGCAVTAFCSCVAVSWLAAVAATVGFVETEWCGLAVCCGAGGCDGRSGELAGCGACVGLPQSLCAALLTVEPCCASLPLGAAVATPWT